MKKIFGNLICNMKFCYAIVAIFSAAVVITFYVYEAQHEYIGAETEAEKAVLSHLGEDYSFQNKGAIKYFVKNGVVLKGGYHAYYLDNGIIYGISGARIEVVVPESGIINQEGGYDKKSIDKINTEKEVLDHLGKEYSFHNIGGIKYIAKNGLVFRGGYHTYYLEDGVIYGEIGAHTEVVMPVNGIINQAGGVDKLIRERVKPTFRYGSKT